MIEIIENYKDYDPPQAVLKSLKRLIRYTDKKYLAGISYVELTNIAALNRESRRQKSICRKKSVFLHDSLGWYSEKWNDEPAHIILVLDNIFNNYPQKSLRWRFTLDYAIGRVFFHEVGHHIHKTKIPEYRETENVADEWQKRLYENFFKKCYWYLHLLSLLFLPFGYLLFFFWKRHSK